MLFHQGDNGTIGSVGNKFEEEELLLNFVQCSCYPDWSDWITKHSSSQFKQHDVTILINDISPR